MREILFRGKRDYQFDETQDWVYGIPYIDYEDDCIMTGDGFKLVVQPETVGQYTGVTDRNGKKIFEGDIVKYGETIHKVVFEQRNKTAYFGIVYDEQETLPFGHYQDLKQIRVIGNIHDNPELLKEGEQE